MTVYIQIATYHTANIQQPTKRRLNQIKSKKLEKKEAKEGANGKQARATPSPMLLENERRTSSISSSVLSR